MMIVSDKQKEYRNRWDKKHMKTLGCKLKKEQAVAFERYAKEQGKTVNALLTEYVMRCIGE
jgi:hypothetical protein